MLGSRHRPILNRNIVYGWTCTIRPNSPAEVGVMGYAGVGKHARILGTRYVNTYSKKSSGVFEALDAYPQLVSLLSALRLPCARLVSSIDQM